METPKLMSRCMSAWVGQWVGSCEITKNNFDLIKIIQFWTFWTFLLKPPQPFAGLIYDLFYRVWGHDLLLEQIILNISTNSGMFYVKLSQQGWFL